MTKQEMLRIAMRQSAEDMGCGPEDFQMSGNVLVPFHLGKNARRYRSRLTSCSLVSYGNNVVAAATEGVRQVVEQYIRRFEFYHCFEPPNLHWLNERLVRLGHKILCMEEYYLPDIDRIPELSCTYDTRLLGQADFANLYRPEWSNALCAIRRELDVLGVGAFDGKKLVGLAACSEDCDQMWQIGVDVLPEYRLQGIASALTSALTREILNREKIPFYCSAWSNLRSVRNAVKSGFIPAWVEMSAMPIEEVDRINREQGNPRLNTVKMPGGQDNAVRGESEMDGLPE